jgi:hypothetical protein
MAKDKRGGACAFFLDPTLGPHIIGGSDGLKWCGKDVKDLWDTVNKDARRCRRGRLVSRPQSGLVLPSPPIEQHARTRSWLDVTELTPDEEGDLRGGWSVYTGTLRGGDVRGHFSNTCAAVRSRNAGAVCRVDLRDHVAAV